VFTTSNNIFGPTEISYLENRFCNLARVARRYEVKNGPEPTLGNITEEKKSELEEFVDNAKLMMGILGHMVFEPMSQIENVSASEPSDSSRQPKIELHLKRKIKSFGGISVSATGRQTNEGFVVLRGSVISPEEDHTVSSGISKRRKNAKIDASHALLEDELFDSPSGAAVFVIGKSSNGLDEWKTGDGKSLNDLKM